MSITESLTKKRVIELKKARKINDFRNLWSRDGKILFLDVSDRSSVKVFYDLKYLIFKLVAQRCCLMKGKYSVCCLYAFI